MLLANRFAAMADRLSGALTKASSVITHMGEAGKALKANTQHVVTEDSFVGRVIGPFRVYPDAPAIEGIAFRDGSVHSFTVDKIYSASITDPNAKTIGAHFPSDSADGSSLRFAEEGLDKVKRETFRIAELPVPGGESEWIPGEPVPAAWAGDELAFTSAHAYPDGYMINYRPRPWTEETVAVDGKNFGHAVLANQYFQRATENMKSGSLIQLSCSPAAGTAAETSSAVLHANGVGLDVYANHRITVTDHRPLDDAVVDVGTAIELDEVVGPAVSSWQKFAAPGKDDPDLPN